MFITNEQKLRFYRQMLRLRTFEEISRVNFLNGKFQGFLHLCVGEEASIVGITEALKKEDYICSTHRGHGVILGKGADPKLMMAELAGRATGLSGGYGGSMHMADSEYGILGSNGIVGAGVPIAMGVALAQKITGSKNVSVAYFGDGASNEGGVHEAMNFAAVQKLPVVFACVNNLYGMWTRFSDASAITDIADRAAGYNMPGVIADGNDVIASYEAMCEAVDRARNGGGPTLIEFKTYRWYDHSVGLRDDFRPKEENESWKAKCPIHRFEEVLLNNGFDKVQLEQIQKEVTGEMEQSFEFAMSSPYPEKESIIDRVYTNLKVEVRKV